MEKSASVNNTGFKNGRQLFFMGKLMRLGYPMRLRAPPAPSCYSGPKLGAPPAPSWSCTIMLIALTRWLSLSYNAPAFLVRAYLRQTHKTQQWSWRFLKGISPTKIGFYWKEAVHGHGMLGPQLKDDWVISPSNIHVNICEHLDCNSKRRCTCMSRDRMWQKIRPGFCHKTETGWWFQTFIFSTLEMPGSSQLTISLTVWLNHQLRNALGRRRRNAPSNNICHVFLFLGHKSQLYCVSPRKNQTFC